MNMLLSIFFCADCRGNFFASGNSMAMKDRNLFSLFIRLVIISHLWLLFNYPVYGNENQKELTERLFRAVNFRKTAEIRDLIPKITNLNALMDWSSHGRTTALILAAQSSDRNVEIIDTLLRAGAHLDTQSGDGYTALSSASRSFFGHIDNLQALLKAGANPNIPTKYGDTPIILATEAGRPEFVKALVNAGAKTDAINNNNCSAMEVAQIKAAQWTTENKPEMAEVFSATEQVLRQNGAKSNSNRLFWCSLSWGIEKQGIRKKMLEQAIQNGAQVQSTLKNGTTPIMYAILQLHDNREILLEIIGILVSNKAAINQRNIDGKTALSTAIEIIEKSDDAEAIISVLLKKGAKPNIGDVHGVTPLMISAGKSWPSIVRLLISFGAKANSEDNWGWSPLIYAWHACSVESFQVMRQAKANIHHVDKSGLNILDHGSACGEGAAISRDELMKMGVKPSPSHSLLEFMPMAEANSPGSDEEYLAFRRMIEKTPRKYMENNRSLILFHSNYPRVIEILLQSGVNPNNQDHEGNSALMHYLESCATNAHENCSQENILAVIGSFAKSKHDFTITNIKGKKVHSIAIETFQQKGFDVEQLKKFF